MRALKKSLLIVAALVLGLAGAAAILLAVPSSRYAILRTVLPMTASLAVAPLRGGAYWVTGGISNTGFVVGPSGVVVIDTQMFLPTAREQLEAIAKITREPVTAIVLTHSDPDHINGLPAYPRGVEVIAQANAAREIRHVVEDPSSNGFPPDPEIADHLPTHVVEDRETVRLAGVTMEFIHTAPAHTDGDLAIYLPDQRLVYAGDLLTPGVGPYPGLHLDKHGSSLGWIASVKAILALDADLYVPGHGELLDRKTVQARLEASEVRRGQIKALFDQGRSLAQARAALNDKPLEGMASRFPTFVETTYQELAAEKAASAAK